MEFFPFPNIHWRTCWFKQPAVRKTRMFLELQIPSTKVASCAPLDHWSCWVNWAILEKIKTTDKWVYQIEGVYCMKYTIQIQWNNEIHAIYNISQQVLSVIYLCLKTTVPRIYWVSKQNHPFQRIFGVPNLEKKYRFARNMCVHCTPYTLVTSTDIMARAWKWLMMLMFYLLLATVHKIFKMPLLRSNSCWGAESLQLEMPADGAGFTLSMW